MPGSSARRTRLAPARLVLQVLQLAAGRLGCREEGQLLGLRDVHLQLPQVSWTGDTLGKLGSHLGKID
jgi:hypothetical protein